MSENMKPHSENEKYFCNAVFIDLWSLYASIVSLKGQFSDQFYFASCHMTLPHMLLLVICYSDELQKQLLEIWTLKSCCNVTIHKMFWNSIQQTLIISCKAQRKEQILPLWYEYMKPVQKNKTTMFNVMYQHIGLFKRPKSISRLNC